MPRLVFCVGTGFWHFALYSQRSYHDWCFNLLDRTSKKFLSFPHGEFISPRRLNNGKLDRQHTAGRNSQEAAAQLRNALSLELPEQKQPVGRTERRAEGGYADSTGCGGINVVGASGRIPPRRRSKKQSLPPARHAPQVSAPPHPATFPNIRYARSSHRPGLSFFECIPSRALINVATTLVFMERGAAERVRVVIDDHVAWGTDRYHYVENSPFREEKQ